MPASRRLALVVVLVLAAAPLRTAAAEEPVRTLVASPEPMTGGSITGPGIDCPWDCVGEYDDGEVVTLVAEPGAGTFLGWEGDCQGTATCVVTMDADREVHAVMDPPGGTEHTLVVGLPGLGSGRVTGPGIDCPGDCSQAYEIDTAVELRSQATGTSTFHQWDGWCFSDDPVCIVYLDQDRQVDAVFDPPVRLLTVRRTGPAGRIQGPGIDCPGDCHQQLFEGTSVRLRASAPATAGLVGWSGTCTGRAACQFVVDGAESVTGRFGTRPSTTLLGVTVGPGRAATIRFRGAGGLAPRTFECRLDASSWSPCTSPHRVRGLTRGLHTVRARAVGGDGLADSSPVTTTFRA
jgi:hypothetical protein